MSKPPHILIQGARVNNLKNVHCQLPHQQFTVITGPSGSGKSSLAFDTLFAEGQRRYIESMSSYARQFLARIEKPDVDQIQHILPAIALEQKNGVKNARSTVGTATEINDFLRLLFANIGVMRCAKCDALVHLDDPYQIQEKLQTLPIGSRVILTAPVSNAEFSPEQLTQQGFFRAWYDGSIVDFATHSEHLNTLDSVDIVIDRLILKDKPMGKRLLESVRNALSLSNGVVNAMLPNTNERLHFKTQYACQACHTVYQKPTANLFSFNSPIGACSSCEGYGRVIGIDLDKVIPNKNLSLAQGAVHPFTRPAYSEVADDLLAEARKQNIPVDLPWCELSDQEKTFVIDGSGDYEGIRTFFDWMETKKYKVHVRVMLAKYRGYYPCTSCQGARLKQEALSVYIQNQNLFTLGVMPVSDLLHFFDTLSLTEEQQAISKRLIEEVISRLRYLHQMGLGYLTLNRQFRTLSNGEAQRINLATALGSRLTDTLYVLDEPTIGLHARDTERLIHVLQALRDQGNTIVVVEHDPDVMLAADYIVDMGPSGGQDGGHILYEGTPALLLSTSGSLTAKYLSQPVPSIERSAHAPLLAIALEKQLAKKSPENNWFEIQDAQGNNLKNITVRFPKHHLICVTGVSGSGKSTLIKQTLFAAYEHSQSRSVDIDELPHKSIVGLDDFKDVLLVDQSPLGRSARSNPVTYTKAYDDIRKEFALTRKAMRLGITPGHFSFNTPGGRCETCEGLGTLTIDMQFMADVTMQCTDCHGRRFNEAVLSIELNGKTVDTILDMTVSEAVEFFAFAPKVQKKLLPLSAIGLGYIRLGQATSTLSGGETQRLKLASYLSEKSGKKQTDKNSSMLFLFDEPTTGLHMSDIQLLLQAFRNLIAAGHSVLVIEHNIDFIAHADYLVELGPEGGDSGGTVVFCGTVADMMSSSHSPTGMHLKKRIPSNNKTCV